MTTETVMAGKDNTKLVAGIVGVAIVAAGLLAYEWRTNTIASKPARVRNCVENCRRAPNRTLQIRLTIETKAAMGKNSVIFPAGCLTKK